MPFETQEQKLRESKATQQKPLAAETFTTALAHEDDRRAMQRADALLRQMTLEEKAMQLSSVAPIALLGPDGPMRGQLDNLLGDGIGHVAGIGLLGNKPPETIMGNW